ncbi:zinc finger and SCAN domain-containing protein 2-like, partial [Syngnathoides biaculeatus]|uniref:zinc finger and SCAN domain-containing protein 2-like n=1 Tax=Syngnathoides biaculeatus TaxID=300417 RepID=UPI002ADD5D1B
MCARTTGEYMEDVRGPKKEEAPQRQLLGAVFNLQPRIVLRRADITENLNTKWQEPEPLHLKQEMEDEDVHHIKKEEDLILIKKEEEEAHVPIKKEEEENITKFPLTGVPLKSEDEGQSEGSRGAEPPSNSLSQHMRRESDGDHTGGSHPEMVTCFAFGCHHRSGVDDCRFYRFPRKKTLRARLCRQPTQPNDHLCSCHFKDGLMENDPVYFAQNHRKWMDSPDPGKSSQEQSETIVHEMATNSQQLKNEHVRTADDDAHEDHTYASTACSSGCMALITKLKEVEVLQKNVEDLMLECEKRKPMSISDIKDREKKCRKCCDHRVKMCARTSVKYKEEVHGPKKEAEPQCQLLDTAFIMQPRIVQYRTEISENLHPDRQPSVSHPIKEEEDGEEVQRIKEEEKKFLHIKEEEQDQIIQVPSTGVHSKSQDEGQSEERRGVEHSSRNSSSDGDHCEGSQTDGQDDDDDEQLEGVMTGHNANKCGKCSQFRKAFASMRNFKHVKRHTSEMPFSCLVSDKTFTDKGKLKRHTKTHTGEKPFSCLVCGQRFTWKGDLKRHTRTHTGEKPFPCAVCGQRFSRTGHLKMHTRTHTGEKPFPCAVCGQRFSRMGHLKMHTRTHTGEKPFSCSVCGKRFSDKRNLKTHTGTHTGEKPFSCLVCGQRFTQKAYLKVHTRTHTGEKPFSCLVCGQKFTWKGDLKRHTRTHTGEKPFSCTVCGQRFTKKVNIERHTRTHTGEK